MYIDLAVGLVKYFLVNLAIIWMNGDLYNIMCMLV